MHQSCPAASCSAHPCGQSTSFHRGTCTAPRPARTMRRWHGRVGLPAVRTAAPGPAGGRSLAAGDGCRGRDREVDDGRGGGGDARPAGGRTGPCGAGRRSSPGPGRRRRVRGAADGGRRRAATWAAGTSPPTWTSGTATRAGGTTRCAGRARGPGTPSTASGSARDGRRERSGIPGDHLRPQPGDAPADRRAARRRAAARERAEEHARRAAAGELPPLPSWVCDCPPECAELEDWQGPPKHGEGCLCRCDPC